jgi:alanyl-tRNA synthetase
LTRRLYYEDSHLRSFEAVLSSRREQDGALWVELDRTAFYPGGGGQPSDRGTIANRAVTEVIERDGTIWHKVDGALPGDSAIPCEIDWVRRFDAMQQHTGQHILSRAFVEIARADTRSFHLGEEEITIDIDHPGPSDEVLRAVEERASGVVWEDREVATHVVSREEALRYPLRKPPDVDGPVRVVEVAGYDWSACGGTHVSRSGEVGLIAILATERYKGGTRVAFVAGGRALRRLREKSALLRETCLEFTAGESDLLKAVRKLREERDRLDRRLRPLIRESLEREARLLLEGAPRGAHGPAVARYFPERDPEEAGHLAAMIAAGGGVALLVSGGATPRAHFSAPAGTISVGALLGEICRRHGGRGGGRPECAQGTIPPERIETALREALDFVVAREKGAVD